MPNRLLHESICTSDTLDQLDPEEEVFFYRLIVQCDDYGRLDARPAVLLARCFPLRGPRLKAERLWGWVAKLQAAGLLWVYKVDEHSYLQIAKWSRYQQGRAVRSKYPDPPMDAEGHPISIDINGYQVKSDALVSVLVSDTRTRLIHAPSGASAAPVVELKPPEALVEFDRVLRQFPTYVPSGKFYETVLDRYSHLALKLEAVKIAEWLTSRQKRRCSTVFVLNWLGNAAGSAAARAGASRPGESQASAWHKTARVI